VYIEPQGPSWSSVATFDSVCSTVGLRCCPACQIDVSYMRESVTIAHHHRLIDGYLSKLDIIIDRVPGAIIRLVASVCVCPTVGTLLFEPFDL